MGVGRPCTAASHFVRLSTTFVVAEQRKPTWIQDDSAVANAGGEILYGGSLGGRQDGVAQCLHRDGQRVFRSDVAVESHKKPVVDRGGRRATELLLGDRTAECCEGSLRRLGEAGHPGRLHQSRDHRVALGEEGCCLPRAGLAWAGVTVAIGIPHDVLSGADP